VGVVTLDSDGSTVATFRLKRPEADSVSVMGDFTAWKPVPMRRQGGTWVARTPLEPGLYHFGFLVDGEWFVPEDAPGRVTDEFGRVNATVAVPAR
jgi:1,4-alpha-glucan branching enzyme